jgi:hypothetical protein
MSSISVASACEASNDERYKKEFLEHATKLDDTGFPLEGFLAMCFSCPTDLSILAAKHGYGEALYDAIYPILVAGHPTGTKIRSCQQRARTLYNAFCALKPGTVVGLKKGFALIAYIEITCDYHFSASEKWGNHRWGYRTLRKATREESAELEARHPIMTFYKDFVSLPADIPRLSIMRKAEERLDTARISLYSRTKAAAAARRELERLEELERDATKAVASAQSNLELLSIA